LRSFERTTTPERHDLLVLELQLGRLRRVYAATLIAVGCAAGWVWLGSCGAVLLGLWGWSGWPRWQTRSVLVRLDRVRYARFGGLRTLWVEPPGQIHQVFADEVPAASLAQLRRELKLRLERRAGSGAIS